MTKATELEHEVEELLVSAIEIMCCTVAEWAIRKGWEPDPTRTFGDEVALVHSEMSEALEAYRIHGFDRWVAGDNGDVIVEAGKWYPENMKPEGVASEFADTLIRMLHYCYVHNINLGMEFLAKMRYNETREIRHGGKLL